MKHPEALAKIKRLETEIATAAAVAASTERLLTELRRDRDRQESRADAAEKAVERLKVELYNASVGLAKAQGYRDRVNEDDTVREELVGEQQLDYSRRHPAAEPTSLIPIPKRDLSQPRRHDRMGEAMAPFGDRLERGPKHWVNL